MAIFSGTIRSSQLAMDTQLTVILPYDRPAENQPVPCKVLYLLHGLGDNAAAWCRYTAIERYARDAGLAVIMPEVQRSFYTDMKLGIRYFSYVAQELPELAAKLFHISTQRADTFVAGLSMGGYGALKCGLTYPEQYAGCASFSGAVDMDAIMCKHRTQENAGEFAAVFGEEALIDCDNLYLLAERCSKLPPEEQPFVFMTCGRQDFLYDINISFKNYLSTIPLPFHFEEWDGTHEWGFWDASVQKAIGYFLQIPAIL